MNGGRRKGTLYFRKLQLTKLKNESDKAISCCYNANSMFNLEYFRRVFLKAGWKIHINFGTHPFICDVIVFDVLQFWFF